MKSLTSFAMGQMPTSAILSIKPDFAEAIFRGEKQFEFRRKVFKTETPTKVFVYASAPISKVIGHFEVAGIISKRPANLWRDTKHAAGISRAYFFEYFTGCDEGHALKVQKPVRYRRPLSLHKAFGIERPPQSFCYVDSPPLAPT
jgi:predicted transcriptional regulator